MTATRRIQILIGLLPTLLVTVVPFHALGLTGHGLLGGELPFWILTVVLFAYVLLVERKALSSIGLRVPGIVDVLLAIGCGFVIAFGYGFIALFVLPRLHLTTNTAEMAKLLRTPLWYRVLLVTRAAVSEELLFRAYPIERLAEWTGRRWIGAVLSLAAFTVAHLAGWGAAHLIFVAFAGGMLTILYLWRRNLWANMLAHWITDGLGFLAPH